MNQLTSTAIAVTLAVATFGCATNPEKIQAASVSTQQYRDFNCNQIRLELTRVTARAGELHGRLKKLAEDDSAQMAIGMILFWPALFFLEGGDGPDAAEYARLKGERDALQKAAVEKNCPPETQQPLQEAAAPSDDGKGAAAADPAK